MLTLILPGLFVLLAQGGCQSGGTDPFACLTDNDCPEDCFCNDEFGFFLCRSDEDNNDFCGGTCDRETACPEGTQCRESHTIERGEDNIVFFSCSPEPGTGGSGGSAGNGGAGGTGGTGGTLLGCDVCGELDCAEFSDDAFPEAGWKDEIIHESGTADYTASQATDTEGTRGTYRFVQHDVGVDSQIWVAHDKPTAIYDPSDDGAIRSLHYSFDGRALEGSRQASIRPLAKQDERWFWTEWSSYNLINEADGWVSKEWPDASLVPAGAGMLDLSVDGPPIIFGFTSGASHTGPDPTTRNTGVDNWRVIVCNE